MDKPTEVQSLSDLPQYTARSIDVTKLMNLSDFEFVETDVDAVSVYRRIANSIRYLFEQQDLVEVVAELLVIPNDPTNYQVHVYGRDPEDGQRYSVFLM